MSPFVIEDTILIKVTFSDLTHYTIPQEVTKIADGNEQDYAFKDFKDHTFTIDFAQNCNIETIGKYSFYQCTKLTSIDFINAQKLKKINSRAFQECSSLTSIEFPQNLEYFLYYGSFSNCTSLETVTFPPNSKLIEIQSGTFKQCPLKTFQFPKNCHPSEALGEAFAYTQITAFSVEDNDTTYIGIHEGSVYSPDLTKLYVYHKGTEFKLPGTTTELVYMTFAGTLCPHIIIPKQITKFGNNIFYAYKGRKITMLSSPPILGNSFFYECMNLEEVIIISDTLTSIVKNLTVTFYTGGTLRSIYLPYSLTHFDPESIEIHDWKKLCFHGNVDIVRESISNPGAYNINRCYIGIKITLSCDKYHHNLVYLTTISLLSPHRSF